MSGGGVGVEGGDGERGKELKGQGGRGGRWALVTGHWALVGRRGFGGRGRGSSIGDDAFSGVWV